MENFGFRFFQLEKNPILFEILRFSLQFVTENRPFFSKKNLAENWLRWSSDGMTKSIFTVKQENFLMGLKIDFEFFEVGQFYWRFPAKKNYKGISQINFKFWGRNKFIEDFLLKKFRRRGVAVMNTRLPHFLLLSAHSFSTVRARLRISHSFIWEIPL